MRRRSMRRAVAVVLVVGAASAVAGWSLLRTSAGDPPVMRGTLSAHHEQVDGRERSWRTYTPEGGQDATGRPLVIVLHGSHQDGDGIRSTTGHRFEELADEHGFVIVYPDAVGNWNECRRGGQWEAKELGIDDVGFLAHVARSTPGVDPDRVFATGFSSGGQMALRLALEAPDLVAGIAPVAATLPTEANSTCTDEGGRVPALFVLGTDDPMNPYDGGEVALWGRFGGRGEVRSAQDSLSTWRDRGPTTPASSLRTIDGGGHQYPAPGVTGPRLFGRTDPGVDTPAEVWDFFAQVPAGRTP